MAALSYKNPVNIRFGEDAIDAAAARIGGARYALITYPEPPFRALTARLAEAAGPAAMVIDDVLPNPDCRRLAAQCDRLWSMPAPVDMAPVEIVVAIGGGSVIDTAKVLAAARAGFGAVMAYVDSGEGGESLRPTPLIAIPTTAGTGSEVTCWATIWDKETGQKHSLAHPDLYPASAIIDPKLMLGKPLDLTRATGLDALSHALESLWNKNANPISSRYAVFAARTILRDLPLLLQAPDELNLRTNMADAALAAGLAFSNTKTAIAHNLSYPITLGHGVPHGIACSFTLPTVLRAVTGLGGFREAALVEIFGADLRSAADGLTMFLNDIGVGTRFTDYGVGDAAAAKIIEAAFVGERGRNFIGAKETFLTEARADGLVG